MENMQVWKLLLRCGCILAFISCGALQARTAEPGRFIEEKVPLRVFGIILAHGVGLGSALLLSHPDSLSRGEELGQSDVFTGYEPMFLAGSGRSEADLFGLSLSRGKMLRPWLLGNARGWLLNMQDHEPETWGGAMDLGFRILPLRSQNWKPYYDIAVGVVYTGKDFPAGGTKINFMSSFGAGLLYRIEPGMWWQAGFRHAHISNAGWIAGDGRNPGFDANGAYTGFILTY